jgi:hypothetical protein
MVFGGLRYVTKKVELLTHSFMYPKGFYLKVIVINLLKPSGNFTYDQV